MGDQLDRAGLPRVGVGLGHEKCTRTRSPSRATISIPDQQLAAEFEFRRERVSSAEQQTLVDAMQLSLGGQLNTISGQVAAVQTSVQNLNRRMGAVETEVGEVRTIANALSTRVQI